MRTLAFAALAVTWVVQSSPQAPPPPPPQEPVSVGQPIRPPTRIKNVAPEYPEDARKVGLEGVVIIEAVIDAEGQVASVEALSGPGPLRAKAVNAVRQWRYTVTSVNGMPVPVIMTVTVNFTLDPQMHLQLEDLVASLRHKDEEIREAAARALGYIKPGSLGRDDLNRARKALRKATEDKSERVRKAAAEALARFQSQYPP